MSTHYSILILEDRPSDAELMAAELRRAGLTFDWQRVESEPEVGRGNPLERVIEVSRRAGKRARDARRRDGGNRAKRARAENFG